MPEASPTPFVRPNSKLAAVDPGNEHRGAASATPPHSIRFFTPRVTNAPPECLRAAIPREFGRRCTSRGKFSVQSKPVHRCDFSPRSRHRCPRSYAYLRAQALCESSPPHPVSLICRLRVRRAHIRVDLEPLPQADPRALRLRPESRHRPLHGRSLPGLLAREPVLGTLAQPAALVRRSRSRNRRSGPAFPAPVRGGLLAGFRHPHAGPRLSRGGRGPQAAAVCPPHPATLRAPGNDLPVDECRHRAPAPAPRRLVDRHPLLRQQHRRRRRGSRQRLPPGRALRASRNHPRRRGAQPPGRRGRLRRRARRDGAGFRNRLTGGGCRKRRCAASGPLQPHAPGGCAYPGSPPSSTRSAGFGCSASSSAARRTRSSSC